VHTLFHPACQPLSFILLDTVDSVNHRMDDGRLDDALNLLVGLGWALMCSPPISTFETLPISISSNL
jgi:hypothetical protein